MNYASVRDCGWFGFRYSVTNDAMWTSERRTTNFTQSLFVYSGRFRCRLSPTSVWFHLQKTMIRIFSHEGFPGPRERRRRTCELQDPQKEGCRAEHGYLANHPPSSRQTWDLLFPPIFFASRFCRLYSSCTFQEGKGRCRDERL